MRDDKHKSQPASQPGKDFDAQNIEDEVIICVSIEEEDVGFDEDLEDEDVEDEDFDELDMDEGRAWSVSDDEDPVEREARLGNRITRDDGDNDDLGELK